MTMSHLGRGLRWLLAASLALNVALLAGIAWEQFDRDGPRGGGPGHHLRGGMMPSPMRLRHSLPEERRAVVDAVLHEHHARIRESIRGVLDARASVHTLMAAETIDRAALDRAFADLRERDAEAARAVQAMLTELATELTPEERRDLAESMHRHPRWRDREPARAPDERAR